MSAPATQPDATILRFDARLLRHDRVLGACVAAFASFLVGLDTFMTSLGLSSAAFSLGAAVLAWGIVAGRDEPVCIEVRNDGFRLRRRGSVQDGEWYLFEAVRLRHCGSSHRLVPRWRLTLVNRFKPSIGSFLHTRSADRVIFYFPLEFDLEAPRDAALALRNRLSSRISSAVPTRSPFSRLVAAASTPRATGGDAPFDEHLRTIRPGG